MNADETKRTEEFITDDSEAEMTQPHPGEFPAPALRIQAIQSPLSTAATGSDKIDPDSVVFLRRKRKQP